MGIKKLSVCFDNPKQEYYNGETVKVQIKVIVDSPVKLNSIKLKVTGNAATYWSEEGWATTTIYNGEEIFFDNKFIVLEKSGSKDLELGVGEHNYGICFELPEEIPPTYVGKKGCISYYVIATVDQPWRLNKTSRETFVVKQVVDLNQEALSNPNIREPGIVQVEEDFSCCCSGKGQVSALVTIPYRGFVRGQKVPILIEIENESNVAVLGLGYNIIQRDTFFTTLRGHKKIKEETLITGNIKTPVQPRTEKIFTIDLGMPDMPFINLRHCQVIDVDYILQFYLKLDSSAWGLAKEIPITFGTIQLDNFESVPLIDPPPYES